MKMTVLIATKNYSKAESNNYASTYDLLRSAYVDFFMQRQELTEIEYYIIHKQVLYNTYLFYTPILRRLINLISHADASVEDLIKKKICKKGACKMANVCFNTLEISGDLKEVTKFKDLIEKEEHQIVNTVITNVKSNTSLSETVVRMKAQYPDAVVYTKQHNNGTAIYTEHTSVQEGFNLAGAMTKFYNFPVDKYTTKDGSLCYGFETKWGPAENLMENMSEKYPELTFKLSYSEEGCEVYGIEVWKNRKLISGEYPDVNWTTNEFRSWLNTNGLNEYEYNCPECGCYVSYDEVDSESECPNCEEELPHHLIK